MGKPEGVSHLFLTYFDYFFGVNTNLERLRGTRGGLKPPDKSSTGGLFFVKINFILVRDKNTWNSTSWNISAKMENGGSNLKIDEVKR